MTENNMYKGHSYNITNKETGRISIKKPDDKGTSYILSTANDSLYLRTGNLIVPVTDKKMWHIEHSTDIDYGDIVTVFPNGTLDILYKSSMRDNILFLTENCNNNCIMCPQPPQPYKSKYYHEAEQIIEFIIEEPEVIGISGGEPTLFFTDFINVIIKLRKKFPNTHIQLLTNGSILSNKNNTTELINAVGSNITFCLPMYGPAEYIHNSIVQNNTSFRDTVKAIYNLSDFNADIEIRTVIIKQNQQILDELAHHITMNFPFISHVAFMGAELVGTARTNMEQIKASPDNYTKTLTDAIKILNRHYIKASIYSATPCQDSIS